MNASRRRQVFFEVHQDLPREGPGNRESTERALDLSGIDATAALAIADLGCGPGQQMLHLAARLPRARILALDLHLRFLRDLANRAQAAGVSDRVTAVCADMNRLPMVRDCLDLIWCEGAAYLIGVPAALEAWRPLLRTGGVCAFTEAAWLAPNPPEPARDFWNTYPAMTDVAGNRTLVGDAGYELLGDFVLPASAWWDEYYEPMSQRLTMLETRYAGDSEALGWLAEERAEIDLYREFGSWYGYVFLVARKT